MNPDSITIIPDWNPNPNRRKTYTVKFFAETIDTVVTSTPAVARQWVHTLRYNHRRALYTSSLTIGLGVQWRPTFSPDSDTAATLQLCVDSDCLIFQLHHASSVPATLRKLLDDRVTFVGVHNGRDWRLLEESEHRLEVECLVDLAKKYGYGNWSMGEMAARMGADDVVKPYRLGVSNWEAYWLSDEQCFTTE
uniref:3'-5' exonuclease domain-containing protein n=1 Tax=Chenopodium quinoa TaxID=63459 RepID=A0A803N2A4_CHEQI